MIFDQDVFVIKEGGMAANLVGWILGVLLFLAVKLLSHKQDPNDKSKFFRDKLREHLAASISGLVVFGLWYAASFHYVARMIASAVGMQNIPAQTGTIVPITPTTSVMAGFISDVAVREFTFWYAKYKERKLLKSAAPAAPAAPGGGG